MQNLLGCNPQVGLHNVDRPRGINDHDLAGLPPGLGQEAFANPGVELQPLHFHAVEVAMDPRRGHFGGQIQHNRQHRQEAAGGDAADFPKGLDVEPTAIALVDHVGQQVAIGNDDFTGFDAG